MQNFGKTAHSSYSERMNHQLCQNSIGNWWTHRSEKCSPRAGTHQIPILAVSDPMEDTLVARHQLLCNWQKLDTAIVDQQLKTHTVHPIHHFPGKMMASLIVCSREEEKNCISPGCDVGQMMSSTSYLLLIAV